MDHPGNTNDFEVKTNSELALLYNNTSVLERHHLAVTLRALKRHEVISSLKADQVDFINATVGKAILATDMSSYFAFCKTLDERSFKSSPLDPLKEEDRLLAMMIIIRASDLSGQGKNQWLQISDTMI